VPGRQDQRVEARQDRLRQPGPRAFVAGERRTPRFVVLAPRVVDGVVEPQGELDFLRVLDGDLRFVEPREAFIEMLDGVVAAMRLLVARDQPGVDLVDGRRRAEPHPRRSPARQCRHRQPPLAFSF
jgi:hypothetical protein